MGRWEPDARGRLERAALDLFSERGYDETIVADIAERAGLTKRTFFRYFPDKREVLFSGEKVLEELFTEGVRAAPASAAPLDAVAAGLENLAPLFEERRELVIQRQRIVVSNPELQERTLIKMASLTRAVAEALHRRGVGEPTASLTAEAGVSVFRVAFARWVDPANRRPLSDLMRESLEELRAVAAAR
ncbi:MAG TPA: TetR family transcriptional regulator [Solirubrobacteraceae bacterium]|nr:TetR family transcriptional regulator [Solirubrobacteraceae bacterium]